MSWLPVVNMTNLCSFHRDTGGLGSCGIVDLLNWGIVELLNWGIVELLNCGIVYSALQL
ncbi:MAG: hypothetical protein V7655_04945 [Aequorivita antarctica]